MLYGLEPGLQRLFEHHGPYEMFQELKLVFQAYARVERYDTYDNFLLGNVVISKKFLRTRKIMVMHSNERGECCLRTLVYRSGSVGAT